MTKILHVNKCTSLIYIKFKKKEIYIYNIKHKNLYVKYVRDICTLIKCTYK